MIADNYPPDVGGIQVVVREIARGLCGHGHHVEVFVHAVARASPRPAVGDQLQVHRYPTMSHIRGMPVSLSLFRSLLRRRSDFDLVHAHNYHAAPALQAALAGMRPLVFTPHYHAVGHTLTAKAAHVVYRPLSKYLINAASRITCVSEAEARLLARDFPHARRKVKVIPNGVDADSFALAEPTEHAGSVILSAGRLERYKQVDRIVLAVEKLSDDCRLIVLGDGPEAPRLRELVAMRRLGHRVTLRGNVSEDELRKWFATADVLVTLSLQESFGLTLLEALASRTPVVASDIPAHRETALRQPRGAIELIPADARPDAVARALSNATRRSMPPGIVIRTWDDVVSDLLDVYGRVI